MDPHHLHHQPFLSCFTYADYNNSNSNNNTNNSNQKSSSRHQRQLEYYSCGSHHEVKQQPMLLPPGFRFHPTDEELITYYLVKKVMDSSFSGGRAIAEVDLNKCEPWHLPDKAKMGEKEWYFFSLRDRKYPTGLRTNRATEAGYWKATGKDREIYTTNTTTTCALVGMKKTLVFYRGRAPKGEKTNWVMHEYRLEGNFSYHFLSRSSKDEWVISRVFQKTGAGAGGFSGGTAASSGSTSSSTKKPRFNPMAGLYTEVSSPSSISHLPPLLDPTTADSYPYDDSHSATNRSGAGRRQHQQQQQHVSCFSTSSTVAPSPAAAEAEVHHRHQMLMVNGGSSSSLLQGLGGLPIPPPEGNVGYDNSASPAAGFPSLRSLKENNLYLQLPNHFFLPPPTSSSSFAGGVSSWMDEGKMSGTNVGGGGSERMGMVMGATELDCMWTY